MFYFFCRHNFRQSSYPKKAVHVPDHDPPNGYVCYRCGEKGHWIQKCPTNDNAEFDNRPRLKRTTGIPRSFLKTVDKSVALAQGGGEDDAKRPTGIMMNADGQFVIAEPDKASWEQFQAKAKSSSAANAASADDMEIQEKGLDCSLDRKMFIDPMKTPCCQKTFCNDCITNALIESDFVCPACQQEGVLIDDLQADDEMAEKIKQYLKEKDSRNAKSPTASTPPMQLPPETKTTTNGREKVEVTKSPSPPKESVKPPSTEPSKPVADGADGMQLIQSKKRPADDSLDEAKIPKAPKAMQHQNPQASVASMVGSMNGATMMSGMVNLPLANMMPFGGGMNMNMMSGFPVGMPVHMMSTPQMGMPTNPMMGMMTPMMGMGGFNPMAGGFHTAGSPMMGGGFGDMGNGFGDMSGGYGDMSGGGGGMAGGMINGVPSHGLGVAQGRDMNDGVNLRHRQHNNFNMNFGQPVGDDDAYFRKPVNPHRHQNRQRRIRPSDYREL